MGKKRKHEEDDLAHIKKRRRDKSSSIEVVSQNGKDDAQSDESSMDEQVNHSSRKHKKVSFANESRAYEDSNHVNGMSDYNADAAFSDDTYDNSDYTLYLVKLPKKLSLDELQGLQLPSKVVPVEKEMNIDGKAYSITVDVCQSNMVYVSRENIQSAPDPDNIPNSGLIAGCMVINEIDQESKLYNIEDNVSANMKSIRTKPVLELDTLSERLQAFGAIPQKKKRRKSKKVKREVEGEE